MSEPVRLQRYLATAGVAARRKCETLITEGRVTVNGKIVTVLGTKVDPDNDEVEVDGEAVVALDSFYVLLNKPKGCITAVTDDRGRPTVMDYLPNLPVPVKPVGRLDFYTEGVLLLTNDGELAARLLAPASHVPKTYHVKVHAQLTPDDLRLLRQGIRLDDGTETMPAEVNALPGESKHTWLGITIHEGKHRQIHRMIEALGYQVDKLQRVAFGPLTFHDLRIGDARELSQMELNALRDSVSLDHSKVARGRWNTRREATDIPRRARAKARVEADELHEEIEARRAANAARRAANAGDAWDGEGDEGGDSEGTLLGTGIDPDNDNDVGDDDEGGGIVHHTGLGMGERDRAGGPTELRTRGGRGAPARGGRDEAPRGRGPGAGRPGAARSAGGRDEAPRGRGPGAARPGAARPGAARSAGGRDEAPRGRGPGAGRPGTDRDAAPRARGPAANRPWSGRRPSGRGSQRRRP